MKLHIFFFSLLGIFLCRESCLAAPTTDQEILQRRGIPVSSKTTEAPVLTLDSPIGGWTTSQMIEVSGKCSDVSVNPIEVTFNGAQYYISPEEGVFKRKFPLSAGRNTVEVGCKNGKGESRIQRSLYAQTSPVPLKLVLTSDTDGVYTDLHVYEPDLTHVYWADTTSPTGGLFFLNQSADSFDKPGYGPYLYIHAAPPVGVFQVDANYWPGGAERHTLASLEVVLNEGTPQESKRRIQKPLARPGETATLAYIIIRGQALPPQLFVPGIDSEERMPPEIKEFQERKKSKSTPEPYAALLPDDEHQLRTAAAHIALAQGKRVSPMWEDRQRDCAGLVRFAFREALRARTENQRMRLGIPSELSFPAVSLHARMHFPYYPALWRTEKGEDAYFADAETLVKKNFFRIGRTLGIAQSADLLVYLRSFAFDEPYHLMMVVKEQGKNLVVYHNGQEGQEGAVRVLTFDALFEADDSTWKPLVDNPHFLGVYRWHPLQGVKSSYS